MIKFERIYEDEDGAWPLDAYLEYVESVSHLMPQGMREFASAYESYRLDGKRTLHDARVQSFSVVKECDQAGVTNRTRLNVLLLDQYLEDQISIEYGGVSSYFAEEPRLLDRQGYDLLLHEFSVICPGRFRHTVMYDGDGGYTVDFSEFRILWGERQVLHQR